MAKSLDEIFTGDETPQVEAETPIEAETPETPEPDAQDAPETPEPSETAEPEKPESKPIPHEAFHAERERRKDAEKRLTALTEQVGQLLPHLSKLGSGEEPKGKEPALDFYADPQKFLTQNLTDLEARINTSLGTTLMAMSESQARLRYEDFDETLEDFAELVKQNPSLRQQLRQVPDPAEWAYSFTKRAKTFTEIGDPAEFEKNLREKVAAEQAAKDGGDPAPNLPKSLATARNVGPGKRTSGPGWQGPTSLEAALAGVPGRAKK